MPRSSARRREQPAGRRENFGDADAVVEAVRRRGSDPRNVRDAAHEACHALDSGMRMPWHRELVHAAVWAKVTHDGGRLDPSAFIACELLARAVEALVCRACRVEYVVERWAAISYLEALSTYNLRLPAMNWVRRGIELHIERPEAHDLAGRILRLR